MYELATTETQLNPSYEHPYTILDAQEATGPNTTFHWFSDLTTPDRMKALLRLMPDLEYVTVMAAQLPDGQLNTFYSDQGSHSEFEQAILNNPNQFGLQTRPSTIFGAQWDLHWNGPESISFHFPRGETPQGQDFFDAAMAVISTIDQDRYSTQRPLPIHSDQSPNLTLLYTGGSTLKTQPVQPPMS